MFEALNMGNNAFGMSHFELSCFQTGTVFLIPSLLPLDMLLAKLYCYVESNGSVVYIVKSFPTIGTVKT